MWPLCLVRQTWLLIGGALAIVEANTTVSKCDFNWPLQIARLVREQRYLKNHKWYGVCNQMYFSPQSLGAVLIYSHRCNRRDLGCSSHLRQTSRQQHVAVRVRRRLCLTGEDFVTYHWLVIKTFDNFDSLLTSSLSSFREFCCLCTAFWIRL